MSSLVAGADGPAVASADDPRLADLQAIAELRHPHLIVMLPRAGIGFEPDLDGGQTLAELTDRMGASLELPVRLRILLDVLRGLLALHRAKSGGTLLHFVHGAVTPANIIVGRDGAGRLIPLAPAHWLPDASPAGETVSYSAPEKLLGDTFGQRADVFSVGVLFWEAIAGKSLFTDVSLGDIVTQLVGGKVMRPVSTGGEPWTQELADVVMRALAADPAERWEHVGAMGAAIETVAEGHLASASQVASLVAGRQTSRDSFSEEVTRPLSAVQSLTPLSNSIPAVSDRPSSPDLSMTDEARREGAELLATEVGQSRDVIALPPVGASAKRRKAVVMWSLGVSVGLIGVAGIEQIEPRTVSTSTAPVLAAPSPLTSPSLPSVTDEPQAVAEPAVPPPAPLPEPTSPLEPVAPSPELPSAAKAPTAAPPQTVAPLVPKAKAVPASVAISPATAPSGDVSGKAKAKGDPFGLMKPVKSKPKEDAFGL